MRQNLPRLSRRRMRMFHTYIQAHGAQPSTCIIQKKDRAEVIPVMILDAFKKLTNNPGITLSTSLGKWGLDHTPHERKLYHGVIMDLLGAYGCRMRTLKPVDFADPKYKTIGDISTAVVKDME